MDASEVSNLELKIQRIKVCVVTTDYGEAKTPLLHERHKRLEPKGSSDSQANRL